MRKAILHTIYAFIAFLVLLFVIFCTTSFGRRIAWSIYSPMISFVQNTFRSFSDNFRNSSSLPENKQELQLRVRELELRLNSFAEMEAENRQLRKLLNLPVHPSWQALAAEVISRDPFSWNRDFVINKGLVDSIQVGAAVLSGPYVIGRVIQVNRHSAKVASLLSPECRFSVKLSGDDNMGLSIGAASSDWQSDALFQVDFLPKDLQVEKGQILVSSGLGATMPAGLEIAEIVPDENGDLLRIHNESRGMFLCRPLAKLQKVKFVIVLIRD